MRQWARANKKVHSQDSIKIGGGEIRPLPPASCMATLFSLRTYIRAFCAAPRRALTSTRMAGRLPIERADVNAWRISVRPLILASSLPQIEEESSSPLSKVWLKDRTMLTTHWDGQNAEN